MNIPEVTIKQLLEAGVHLGHKTLRWNPKMNKFIFGEKNSIHIIDLTKTVKFNKRSHARSTQMYIKRWKNSYRFN